MNIFGWSYPPGAANDPYAPYNDPGGPELDWDESDYTGNDQDGVYHGAVQDDGGQWFAVADVDCNTAGFTDSLCVDGPYPTEEAAAEAAKDAAVEWCATNNVYNVYPKGERP